MTKRRKKLKPLTDARPYRERRMKFFTCKGTRHQGDAKSQTLKKRYAEMQLCRKCRKGVDANPNQTSLFGQVDGTPIADLASKFETPCDQGGIKHRTGCRHDSIPEGTVLDANGEPVTL
ncbi:MAG: hypothetical protein RIS45_854 [Planctomycetota bacterium]|jgi:hypothetical protein